MASKKRKVKSKFPSELRLDTVSGDWVVIATGRAKRPETFKKEKRIPEKKETFCPFCDMTTQETPTLVYSKNKRIPFSKGDKIPENWTTIIIPNKYPAFLPSKKLSRKIEDTFYERMNAVGFHEVIVTKDHKKSLGQMKVDQVKEVIDVYQERYLELKDKPFVNYIAIFHNHGKEAGASISHPHSQLITTPLIDTDLKTGITKSESFTKEKGECIYCLMNKWEIKFKKRIVFENDDFIVLCPFASKAAFEMIISPKKHLSYFEEIEEDQKWNLAEAFKFALGKLHKNLNDPSYNFYLHSAPCDGQNHDHYHWHFTILPKTSTWAGFEMGAQMEISTIEPEEATKYLRK